MPDLAAGIRDALDAIEARAKAATPGPWRSYLAGSEGARIYPDSGDKREDSRSLGIMNGRDAGTDRANAAHAAANDPVSVLRQVQGMRQILDRHVPSGATFTFAAIPEVSRDVCRACSCVLPCPDVLSLAFMVGVTQEETQNGRN